MIRLPIPNRTNPGKMKDAENRSAGFQSVCGLRAAPVGTTRNRLSGEEL
jgi:hypothetical protein